MKDNADASGAERLIACFYGVDKGAIDPLITRGFRAHFSPEFRAFTSPRFRRLTTWGDAGGRGEIRP